MKMNSLSAEARAKRLNAVVDPGRIISLRAYNLILTAAVLYGVAINAILCRESIVRFVFDRVNPITFFIIYFVMVIAGVIIAHRSENPLVSFLGYNMIVGRTVCRCGCDDGRLQPFRCLARVYHDSGGDGNHGSGGSSVPAVL